MENVVTIQFGSHLYGTNTINSDQDFKSVFIPDAKDILLQRAKGKVSDNRVKADGEKNNPGEMDVENFSIQGYLKLLSEGQTVALDMLFAPDAMLLKSSPVWSVIQANKQYLLSKKSAAFVGYCRQQANKYGIKGSRVAAAKKASEFFGWAMGAYGPLAKVQECAIEFDDRILGEHTDIVTQQVNKDGDMGTFFRCCNRMVGFNNTVKEAHAIFTRIYENYGARAKLAESNSGVDWKALSHAVRVGTEALELLTTGHITFPLPNCVHVRDIKLGNLDYNVVAEEIESLLEQIEAASLTSSLPETADQEWIDDFVSELHYIKVKESYPGVRYFSLAQAAAYPEWFQELQSQKS